MRNHLPLCLATIAVSVPTAAAFNHFGFGTFRPLALAPALSRSTPSPSTRTHSVKMSGSAGGRRLTAEEVLKSPKWPATWPYSAQDFARSDESEDEFFYDSPRLVYHIDDKAGKVAVSTSKLVLKFADCIQKNSCCVDRVLFKKYSGKERYPRYLQQLGLTLSQGTPPLFFSLV
jgi:hypothetical protein